MEKTKEEILKLTEEEAKSLKMPAKEGKVSAPEFNLSLSEQLHAILKGEISSLRMEVIKNKFGDIVRIRVFRARGDDEADDNLLYTDRQSLIERGGSMPVLYKRLKDTGISTIERTL